MARKLYPSDLTDEQWELIELVIPPFKPGACGRSRRFSKDYERRTDSSESKVRMSAIHLLLKRMAPADSPAPFKYRLAA